jgi:hypothetical protein
MNKYVVLPSELTTEFTEIFEDFLRGEQFSALSFERGLHT